MSSEPAIRVERVSKRYEFGLSGRRTSFAKILANRLRHPLGASRATRESFLALDDVSFDVESGEVVGVIGKNGAGKSTLLKILSRITGPTSGQIDMAGSVGSLLEVGTGFHPELTGMENMYLNGAILGMTNAEIDRRKDEIIEFSGVHRFLDTPVKRYSSGMRVRLAFAVAAHLDTEIMIVDEVLSVGDYAFQAKCLEKMRSIASEDGRTVLYVSHNLVTVEHLCPRAILLVDGSVVTDGPTGDTVARYMEMVPRAQRGSAAGVFDLAVADRSAAETEVDLFKRLLIRPGGGAPADSVRMGDRLRIEIDVDGLHEIADANVHVTVGNDMTACLFRMTGRMMPFRAEHARSEAETVVIDIPSVPLTPGEYKIAVGVHTLSGNLIDEVFDAGMFTVLPSDVLGNGYQFAARDGQFMVPWEWEVRPDLGVASEAS